MKDPIRIVEAAYSSDAGTESEWLNRIADTVLCNLPVARAAIAYSYEIELRGRVPWIAPRAMAEINTPPGLGATYLNQGPQEPPIQRATLEFHRATGLESGLAFMRSVGVYGQQERFYRESLRSNGFEDILVLKSADPTPLGCVIALPTESTSALHRATLRHWKCVAAHVSAGFRIYRKIAASGAADPTHAADAILESNGAVAHATAAAAPRSARDALRAAVLAADRARGPLRRRAPDEAIETWRGLVSGRWTLLDHFDRDGRRYVVAHRNDPDAPDPRALTHRERQVVGYVALGQSNKLIAYELGLSESTIGVVVHRAAAKLGVRSRVELGMFGFHRGPPGSTDE